MICFDTNKLAHSIPLWKQAEHSTNKLEELLYQLHKISSVANRQRLHNLSQLHSALHKRVSYIRTYVMDTILIYEQMEMDLLERSNHIIGHNRTKINTVKGLATFNMTQASKQSWMLKESFLKHTHQTHTSFSKDKGIMGYVKNGICAGIYEGFHLAQYSANKDMKYLQANADLKIGSAALSADAKALLFQNGKVDPTLQLEANVNAKIAEVKGILQVGNSYVNVRGEGSVGVGVVRAEAKAVISKKEITLKADVGAAAIRGEVKGVFTFFGIKISVNASGEVGSIGAGAEFSSKHREFEFGGRFSFLAGIGLKIKVSY